MTLPFHAFVRGQPHTKGAMRPIPNRKTGRTFLVAKDPGGKQRSWQEAIQWVLQNEWDGPPVEGPLCVELEFVFPVPKSQPKSRPLYWHAKSGYDRSKLLRLVEDALESIVCCNDGQICAGDVRKRYGPEPGLHISITALEQMEACNEH